MGRVPGVDPVSDAEEPVRVSRPAAVFVLAAGEGTRMKSATPKVLHEISGRSLVGHVLAAARELDPQRLVVVVGHGREQVVPHLGEIDPGAETVVQERQGGTGHAVRIALEATDVISGTVLVTYGDTPLLSAETLSALAAEHARAGNAVTVLSAVVPDPTGYGRIIRADGEFVGIVEEKDATDEQRAISEMNSGVYAFDGALLADAVKRVTTDNAKGEEYLTDVVSILRADGHRVGVSVAGEWREILGVNDRVQLAEARDLLNQRLLRRWMREGVTVVDPRTTWIDVTVTCEPDALVEPNTQLRGATRIAAGARVGPNSTLTDTSVGREAHVSYAVTDRAEIGDRVSVGPYAFLRPGTRLDEGAKAGTYVEMKNASIGAGSKVPHLTYVGDADIGVGANIGASSVFVNYDGVEKHRSKIGDHVKAGCDNMFVAPVEVGDGAYTGAGTVVRRDVPPGALSVSGGPQRIFEGWVENRRPDTAAAEAARRARERARDDPGTEPGGGPEPGRDEAAR